MMARIKITVAYDGRNYAGWQLQPDHMTVQQCLCDALYKITKVKSRIIGSGRTDTGVHAAGQIAHFDASDHLQMNIHNWVPAFNTALPLDIRVLKAEEVSDDFHAQFGAKLKTYEYRINISSILSPFLVGRVWHEPRQLDKVIFKQALDIFVGEHDFAAFAANRGLGSEPLSTVREITCVEFIDKGEDIYIRITGRGFLYKMVRLIVGGCMKVSSGRYYLEDLQQLLLHPQVGGEKSPLCAPAGGLTLKSVEYE